MKKISVFLFCAITALSILFIGRFIEIEFEDKEKSVENIIKYFPFSSENSLSEWEEKILKGRVIYRIERKDDLESYVRAESKKAASALYYRTRLEVDKKPIIRWKWCVDRFPERTLPERIDLKKEEDFAARIYVIFPAIFFTHSKIVEYIWAEEMPAGTQGTSAYSDNIKIMVLRSGVSKQKWVSEKRDIYEDYIKLFGEGPRLDIGAIAFMTDADSTKTNASAVYDEIKIGYEK